LDRLAGRSKLEIAAAANAEARASWVERVAAPARDPDFMAFDAQHAEFGRKITVRLPRVYGASFSDAYRTN
jgi:hypothetical protein